MSIIPACEIRRLSDCDPGHLVRPLGHWPPAVFGIVGTIEDGTDSALLLFQKPKPTYVTEDQPDLVSVLDYGNCWLIEVDHDGPFESRSEHMYEIPGCLIREKSRWLMKVRSEDERFPPRHAQFDLTSFQLVRPGGVVDNIAVWGRWALYIGDEARNRDSWQKVIDYRYSPPDGQSA